MASSGPQLRRGMLAAGVALAVMAVVVAVLATWLAVTQDLRAAPSARPSPSASASPSVSDIYQHLAPSVVVVRTAHGVLG